MTFTPTCTLADMKIPSVSLRRTWMILFLFSFFVILTGTIFLYNAHPRLSTERDQLGRTHKSFFPEKERYIINQPQNDTEDAFNGKNMRNSGHGSLHIAEWNVSTYPTGRYTSTESITTRMDVSESIAENRAMTKLVSIAIRTTSETISEVEPTQPSHQASFPTASKGNCDVHGIESWKKGVITQLKPPIMKNCNLLRQGNRDESIRVSRAMKQWRNTESDQQWIHRMSNCSNVIREFTNNFYVSPMEEMFPLAYILIMYKDARQVVRLLKAIYRPHNLYCIHPDARQGEEFALIFRMLSRCLDNVFVASKLESVYHMHHTIMDSQINCYEDLMKYKPSCWRYVINICGTELPLKTNREIVSSLKGMQGASAVATEFLNPKQATVYDRFKWKAVLNYTTGRLHLTKGRLGPPPHHIKIYKSTNFIAATRPFVNYFLHDRKAIDFRNYLKDVKIPEEHFYASLARLPGVPGGTPRGYNIPVIDEYIWMTAAEHTRKHDQKCFGKMVHYICILTFRDLPEIYRMGVYDPTARFFFNKYDMRDDHVVMDCMEERLIKQNIAEHKQDCQ